MAFNTEAFFVTVRQQHYSVCKAVRGVAGRRERTGI